MSYSSQSEVHDDSRVESFETIPSPTSGDQVHWQPHLEQTPESFNFNDFKWMRGAVISQGTYGKVYVYLATNKLIRTKMAVKQVAVPSSSDQADSRALAVIEALRRECAILKVVDHPHLVAYFGCQETPTRLSVFTEYVGGGSISSCLKQYGGRFNEKVIKSFTHQILTGLEYLHSRGIVHCDINAENILVDSTVGMCKITGFGSVSRSSDGISGVHNLSHIGQEGTAMVGTVFYMAPEVINFKNGYPKGHNPKIDIWSLGCTVLQMWSGSRPWVGHESVAVMFQLYQVRVAPPVPEDVQLSTLAEDFRLKCFAINPEERSSASALRDHPYLV